MFKQKIEDVWQKGYSDRWLHQGRPWACKKSDRTFAVVFGGHTESFTDELEKAIL